MTGTRDQLEQSESHRQALRFVLRMGFVILVAISICTLVWWFFSSRSYNALGQLIMVGGGVLMLIGVLNLGDHNHGFLRKTIGKGKEGRRQMIHRVENQRANPRIETQVLLTFLGSGLLCLFAGYLIVMGL